MSDALLAVKNLNAYYGPAHILQGVSFEMGIEPVAIIGRNGMGKSTLCNAIMGLVPDVKGSVRLNGEELVGRQAYKISNAGIGLVPQGRRLFPSLSTDEHLRMLGSSSNGAWSRERVYELFPRLAERKNISATQLSGGEQQMLAIGRTLLRNPRLLIMDEPSEGLAPTIVESVIGTCLKQPRSASGSWSWSRERLRPRPRPRRSRTTRTPSSATWASHASRRPRARWRRQ